MGLFDYVRCEVPLPDGYTGELQTKEFDDPYMVTHVITKEGRLKRDVILRVEAVPKKDRPYPDAPEGSFKDFVGCQRTVTELRDIEYHGIFRFGGLEIVGRDPPDDRGYRSPHYKSHDYEAKFTDGQLVSISVVD